MSEGRAGGVRESGGRKRVEVTAEGRAGKASRRRELRLGVTGRFPCRCVEGFLA